MEAPIPYTDSNPSNTTDSENSFINDPKAVRRALIVIFLIMMGDITGITILYPVAPFIVARFSSDALMVTMLNVIYAAAQFLAAPVLGKLGDRFGRRPVLIASVIGSVIGYVTFGLGGALWILFLSRLIDGITGGNLSTASAYIADVSKPETRVRNFALIGLAWSMGLIIGPALGGLFSQISLAAPAFVAAGFAALNVVMAYFLLPESLSKERRKNAPIQLKDLNPFLSIRDIASKYRLTAILVVLCLFNFAFNAINSTQALFAIYKFQVEPWQVGLLLLLAGIMVGVVQFGLVTRVVRRFGEMRVAAGSLTGQAIANVLVFFSPSFIVMLLLSLVVSGVSVFTWPTLTAMTTEAVSPVEIGMLMGVTTALGSLMSVFGPLWAGLVYDHIMPGSPYWLSAVIFGLGALILVWKWRSEHREKAAF